MDKMKLKKTILLLILILLINSAHLRAQTKNLNIVFIGNSITHGAGLANPETQAPPVIAAQYLRKQKNTGNVKFSNQGYSGYTTVDFLPATNKVFNKVEQAAKAFADKSALLIFSIKLGTNDSAIQGPNGSPVSPDNYYANLKTIADSLLKEFAGSIVIFQHPVWYSPNTYNGAKYLQEGLSRLQTYIPQIDKLVADYATKYPDRVFAGDKKAWKYFEKHYLTDLQAEPGHQGTFYLHPNEQGAIALGTFWGKAIEKVVSRLK
jgi:lysophospholipase L1-like esterase